MGGRKAQVALFVLAGVIILIMVVLALYLVSQKKAETSTSTNEQLLLQQNPDLAAEKARMQARVDDCLSQTSTEVLTNFSAADVPVNTIADAEQALADEIAARFPDCFFRFNTQEKLTITGDEPRVTATLSADKLNVHAVYAATGSFNSYTYTLQAYDGAVATQLQPMLLRGFAIQQALAGTTPTGTGGSQLDAASLADAKAFIDDDCNVDLYAFEDQGIYADLLTHDDGTMTALLYDYKNLDQSGQPGMYSVNLQACTPKNTATAPQPQELAAPSTPLPCSSKDTACPIKLDTTLPEGFTIISALDINPLTLTLDASQYPAGDYFAVAQGTDANGVAISQPFTVHIT